MTDATPGMVGPAPRPADNAGVRVRHAVALAALIASLVAPAVAPAADVPPQRLRVVGSLASIHLFTRHEEPFWTRDLPRASGGRLTADIVPFDRAGILPGEMLRLVQLGTVPFGTAMLPNSAAQDPELLAVDLAGLNPDIATLRRSAETLRPHYARLLAERHGIELLALYTYPSQVTFCRKPLAGLADLAGRRIRVSSATQADFVGALGAQAVQTPFAEIVPSVVAGNLDCAITGTMSGNTVGLHEQTSHIHSMPVTWGLSAFIANGAAWRALGPEAQALLRRELARVEADVWRAAAEETGDGIACNVGAEACRSGRKGRMVEVRESAEDRKLRREVLVRAVLPAWLKRCGPSCAALWQQSIGPSLGIALP